MPTINKGSDYFGVLTYTGDGSASKTVVDTNAVSFQPDFVWVKGRSGATDHALYDAVRGTTKQLESNTTTAETTETTGVTGFVNGGFTVGNLAQVNTSGATYVAWCWKANGAGSSNTQGSITSTVSVNTTAGFSIVTYTGNGSAGATVGHGLGVAPKMFIVKNRSNGGNDWSTWHTSISPSSNYQVYLSSTAAKLNTWNVWNSTSPSSTTLTLGTDALVNGNGQTYVAYCWADVSGFSKAFSYTGNASTDGPFVFCNFRPRFILFKNSSAATVWIIFDTARNTYNFVDTQLRPNASDADNSAGSAYSMDILSNGFKVRSADSNFNGSGNTIIGMAFAEHPFKSSNAR